MLYIAARLLAILTACMAGMVLSLAREHFTTARLFREAQSAGRYVADADVRHYRTRGWIDVACAAGALAVLVYFAVFR